MPLHLSLGDRARLRFIILIVLYNNNDDDNTKEPWWLPGHTLKYKLSGIAMFEMTDMLIILIWSP